MKIVIKKGEYNVRPLNCIHLQKEVVLWIDERYVDHPSKLKNVDKNWCKEGINHRVEKGHIKRDFRVIEWVGDLTIENLITILDNHSKCEINKTDYKDLEGNPLYLLKLEG